MFCLFLVIKSINKVPTAQGKQGKKIPVRENTGNLVILPKHRILFAQVVNSLILKVKDIAIIAAKISIFSQKLDRSANSVLCMQ